MSRASSLVPSRSGEMFSRCLGFPDGRVFLTCPHGVQPLLDDIERWQKGSGYVAA